MVIAMAVRCFLCVDSGHEDEASLGQHLASHHRVERGAEVILALHSLGHQRRTQLVRESQDVPEKTAIKRQNPTGVDNFERVSKKAIMKKIRKSEEELTAEVLNNPDILEQIFNHLPPDTRGHQNCGSCQQDVERGGGEAEVLDLGSGESQYFLQ